MIYTGGFIFPPRPERKVHPENLDEFDNGKWLAQPKYNGSGVVVMLDGNGGAEVRNRHNEPKSYLTKKVDFAGMLRGSGPMVVTGELMNKAKKGEYGNPFNEVFVICDILVYSGMYLIGSTTEERLDLLHNIYPGNKMFIDGDGKMKAFDNVVYANIQGVYLARVYTKYFAALYERIIKVDAYEGLVLKKANAKLEFGLQEKNNTSSHLKARKPTKNYRN